MIVNMMKESHSLSMIFLCIFYYNSHLEKIAMNLKKANLKTYVIVPGVMYGLGEHKFYKMFR